MERIRVLVVATLASSAVLLAGCSSSSDTETAAGRARADQLVSAAHAAGLAPDLTADVAEALYGSDADRVCEAFEGGLNSSEEMLALGNPAGRRPKVITTDAVAFGRLVVRTYCPEDLADYDAAVADLDPIESDR